jgi:hypothetical protein
VHVRVRVLAHKQGVPSCAGTMFDARAVSFHFISFSFPFRAERFKRFWILQSAMRLTAQNTERGIEWDKIK